MPLTISNNSAYAIRYLEWGLESRWYPTSSPPPLILDSDSLTASASAVGATRTGAYDPNATGNNVIRATLATQPLVVCSTGNQSHVGTFRVKARVWVASSTTDTVQVRLSHQAGDGPMRAGRWATPPVVNNWAEVDLGPITIAEAQAGTQRWTGQVQAYSGTIGDAIDIDVIYLMPAELYGVARATYAYAPGTLTARDEFTGTTAGVALNGRTAPLGGTWATSGVATDFAAADVGSQETMRRSTTSDAGFRYAVLGSTSYTDIEVGVALTVTGTTVSDGPAGGVAARWTDSSNHLRAYVYQVVAFYGIQWHLVVQKVVAGTPAYLIFTECPQLAAGVRYRVRLIVYASGFVVADVLNDAGASLFSWRGNDPVLATGGTLATGKVALVEFHPGTSALTRDYDEFYAAAPAAEPVVMYPGQSIQVTSDSTLREDATGVYWGNPPSYVGSRFFVPNAGGPGRKARVAVRARRNDIVTSADDAIGDSMTVSVAATPRYVAVPR